MKIKKEKNDDNFLLYIPVIKHHEWTIKEDRVCLIFHHTKRIEKLVAWLTNKPKVTDIKLDKMGTSVWSLIDGKKTVYDIGKSLQESYGKECEPVYKRLTMYLRYLNKKGWIKFNKSNEELSVDNI